jgi:sulfide:quinone oxidoreductase
MARSGQLQVLVAGGGVAALETVLALRDLAGDRVCTTVLAPNEELVYRPLSVCEPFSIAAPARYPLAPMLGELGAELIADELAWVDAERRVVRTRAAAELEFDALVLALGARAYVRYRHAVTIDDRRMDETLGWLSRDVSAGTLDSLAFVAPARMAWPLPLYELALLTGRHAEQAGARPQLTILTSEESPLAVFGPEASAGVASLLAARGIRTIPNAYVEIPRPGELEINPGDRRLRSQRTVALPELYGPAVRGVPVSEHGFIRVDPFGRVPDTGNVFAAGDAVDFPVKQGGIAAQHADVVAMSIAALAGADVDPVPFRPTLHGVLLTGEQPRYLQATLTGGDGVASEFSDTPIDGITQKIGARYLAPYLERRDGEGLAA